VEDLQKQVIYLNSEISKYRFKLIMTAIGENKTLEEIKQMYDFGTNDLLSSLRNGSNNQDLYEKIKQMGHEIGTAG